MVAEERGAEERGREPFLDGWIESMQRVLECPAMHGSARRNSLSRPEPRQRPSRTLSQGRRLFCIRADYHRSQVSLSDPAFSLLFDAQSHWHMVLWPESDGEMTEFLCWLTLTHSQRLHAHRHTTGYGHIGDFRGRC